jgi:hypothetical protein
MVNNVDHVIHHQNLSTWIHDGLSLMTMMMMMMMVVEICYCPHLYLYHNEGIAAVPPHPSTMEPAAAAVP